LNVVLDIVFMPLIYGVHVFDGSAFRHGRPILFSVSLIMTYRAIATP
jgi:hypothetical protein